MSGGGGNSTTTTQQSVPDWMKPYYTETLNKGQNLTDGPGPQYFPGQQVAALNPMQTAGINSIAGAAGQPNASGQAQSANRFIESGALLNPSANPYLQDTFHQAANGVQNQLSSEFAGSGRNIIGSLPVQSDEMNNLATQIYGGSYNTGLDAMVRGQAFAPSVDSGTYQPGQNLLSTGAGIQGQQQNVINADINKYNYQQQLPYNQLSYMTGLLGQNGAPFRSGTSTLPTNSNQWGGALGGAASGAAMGSSFGPWGTGIGAVAGGLLGAFG